MKPVFAQPLIVIDTETTGFHKQAEVIEIGAVALSRKGQILSTFSALIQPKHLDDWRTEKALLVSGITKAELRQAPEPERVRMLFAQWSAAVSRATSVRPKALAYNAAFDKKLLERMGIFCEHLGIEWGECLFTMTQQLLNHRGVFFRSAEGRRKKPSLSNACRYFDIPQPVNAHRALDDAIATANLALNLWLAYTQEFGGTDGLNLGL